MVEKFTATVYVAVCFIIIIDYIKNGKYYFYVKDHLGNNRVVVDLERSVRQSTQYYPFGMDSQIICLFF